MADPLDSATPWVAEHTRKYVETGGEDGHIWKGVPCLVLTTKGRKSGKLRRTALIYSRDAKDYVIIASKGGADSDPLWYLNLIEEPSVTVQVGKDVFRARARTVEGPARSRLWADMAKIWPDYDSDQSKTEREIPVVKLIRT